MGVLQGEMENIVTLLHNPVIKCVHFNSRAVDACKTVKQPDLQFYEIFTQSFLHYPTPATN